MTTKYCVHPGFIVSKTDGDTHYVGYQQLVMLYKVDPKYCELYSPLKLDSVDSSIVHLYPSIVHLYPSIDGNYKL